MKDDLKNFVWMDDDQIADIFDQDRIKVDGNGEINRDNRRSSSTSAQFRVKVGGVLDIFLCQQGLTLGTLHMVSQSVDSTQGTCHIYPHRGHADGTLK